MTVEPVCKSITVPASVGAAFEVFTRQIGSSWPHETHSVGLDHTATVIIEEEVGSRLYEAVDDGTEHDWGSVLVWDPPRRVAVSWHAGRGPEVFTEVEVTFAPGREGAEVTLVHRHWEKLGDEGPALRDQYHEGWDPLLDRYRAMAAAGASRA